MVDAALEQVKLLESLDFDLIKVSLKAFDVPTTIAAYRAIADKIPYPLHIGITEAGTPRTGIIRSSVGIGTLLISGDWRYHSCFPDGASPGRSHRRLRNIKEPQFTAARTGAGQLPYLRTH